MARKKQKSSKSQLPKQEQESFITKHPVLITAILSFALLLVFFNQVMISGKTFQQPDKLTANASLPFVKDALNRGIFPLWCPYIFSGMPSYGSLIRTPRVNVIDWNVRGFFDLLRAPRFTFIFLNYLLFALFMYLLLKSLRVSNWGAMFAAIATVFIPQFIAFPAYGHNTKFLAVTLIPLIFFLANRLMEKRNALYFSLTALAIGWQMMRNHVQVSYYTFMLLGIFFLFKLVADWREKKPLKTTLSSGALLGAAIVVGALLSAVIYASVLDYQRFSIRGGGESGGLDFGYASSWSFHPLEMVTFLIPSFMGFGGQTYWGKMPFTDYPLYFSIVVLLLAGVAFILRRDRMTWFFGVIVLFSLLVSFGRHFPVLFGPMYKFLPLFNKFRVPSMIHILLDIAMVVLAGYGIQAIMDFRRLKEKDQARQRQKLMRYFYIFVGIMAAFTLFLLLAKSGYLNLVAKGRANLNITQRELAYSKALVDSLKSLFLVSVVVVLVLQYLKKSMTTTVFGFSLIVLVVLDLWFVDFKIIHPRPPADEKAFFAETPAVTYIKKDKSIFRIFPVLDNKGGNWYMYHFIQNIKGYHAAKLRIYQEFLEETGYGTQDQYGLNPFISKYWRLLMRNNRIQPQPIPVQQIDAKRLAFDYAMLDMLNVKYLINQALPINDQRYKLVQDQQPWVYENTTVLPRAFFADSVEVLTGRRRIFDRMKDGTFDPRKTAIIEEDPPFAIAPADSNTAVVTSYDIHEINIDASVKKPTILVLSEVYYPSGWRAFVDGVETKIYKTNYILRSIFLQPGEHKILFKFNPRSFAIGLWTSLITLIILLSLLLSVGYVHLKDKKRAAEKEPLS